MSTARSKTPEQTTQALFWTDHDLRQWNDGMLHWPTPADSTSCRRHGCWRWRTLQGATR